MLGLVEPKSSEFCGCELFKEVDGDIRIHQSVIDFMRRFCKKRVRGSYVSGGSCKMDVVLNTKSFEFEEKFVMVLFQLVTLGHNPVESYEIVRIILEWLTETYDIVMKV